jgi:transcriptional regulator with XRE-family HTH domain
LRRDTLEVLFASPLLTNDIDKKTSGESHKTISPLIFLSFNMDIAAKIATRIIELCTQKGITVNKLADLSGLTQSTVDSIVNGKSHNPQVVTIYRICEGLGISLSDFFSDSETIVATCNCSEIDKLPEHIKKEIAMAIEFVLYKHGIRDK